MIKYFYYRHYSRYVEYLPDDLTAAIMRVQRDRDQEFCAPDSLVTEDSTVYTRDQMSDLYWEEYDRLREEAKSKPRPPKKFEEFDGKVWEVRAWAPGA